MTTKTWINVPLPAVWSGDTPPWVETGYIAFCLFGHQWWERVSSPDHCPECGPKEAVYFASHYKPSRLQWFWHLLREFVSGTPVVTHAQYVNRRLDSEEEAQG